MCTGSHPYISANNVAKVEFIYDQDGQQVVNIFHVLSGSGWTTTSMAVTADACAAWFEGSMAADYPAEYSLRTIKVTDLSSPNAPVVQRDYVPPTFGENSAGNPLPNNVTVAVKWLTANRGRSYRGRTFWPVLMVSEVAANRLTSAAVSGIGGKVSQLKSALETGGHSMVVVSYCAGGVWRQNAQVTTIQSYGLNEVVDSQRRRLPERGR